MSSVLSAVEGGVIGVGVGTAAATALEPAFELQRQEAWKESQARILDLGQLAELVVQAISGVDDVLDRAERNGYAKSELLAAIQIGLKAPPYAEVLDLWRRGRFGTTDPENPPVQVTHAFAKAGIEYDYWKAISELFFERLSVQDVAVMVQRGILPNPGWLPVGPPTEVGLVPPMPQAKIDPVAEALSHGFDSERAAALTKIIGLPASPDLAARMTFRNIIERVDFDRAISEGNTRNEWAPFLFEGFREILTAGQYAESRLRGYTETDEEMYANIAKHGMSHDDARLLFLNTGRPLAIHQVTTGLARGGVYNGPTDEIPAVYLDAVRESNIKPPFYNLDYANRFTYPTGFMIKAEAKAGDLPHDETVQILLELGWSPKWAEFFATAWTGGKAAPVDRHIASAQTAVITAARKAYLGGQLTDAAATAELEQAGLTAASAAGVVAHWQQLKRLEALPPAPPAVPVA